MMVDSLKLAKNEKTLQRHRSGSILLGLISFFSLLPPPFPCFYHFHYRLTHGYVSYFSQICILLPRAIRADQVELLLLDLNPAQFPLS